MIIIKLTGGLGNQMFQYALGRHLAEIYQTPLKLDVRVLLDRTPYDHFTSRTYGLEVFHIQADFVTPDDVKRVRHFYHTASRKERLFGYLCSPYRLVAEQQAFCFDASVFRRGKNVLLDGYWQSEHYFKPIEQTIRQEFVFRPSPSQELLAMMRLVSQGESVSVHVRRGDYVSNPVVARFHGVCGLEYYTQAMKMIAQKVASPRFFVFSDDMEWVKAHFPRMESVLFMEHHGQTDTDDLRLMTCCKHHIIANSSFSWWGAWLASSPQKIVIAPQHWINVQTTPNQSHDIFPEHWITL